MEKMEMEMEMEKFAIMYYSKSFNLYDSVCSCDTS